MENWKQPIEAAQNILRHYLPTFTTAFPSAASVHNFYIPKANDDWTDGFITGEYWLAWQLGGGDEFREAALIQVDSFQQRIIDRVVVDHHDMGFLYTPSCVAAYKLTGSEVGKKAALMAADNLMGRFQEKGRFFQAWGALGAEDNYRLIIDCLLNLPLLFWATEVTGDESYAEKARAHIQTALTTLVREDSSTYHTHYFDPVTGKPTKGVTAQGYKNDSAWARGQAWGIYGMALAYRYTEDATCIEMFRRITEYYLAYLPEDGIPYWDLCFTENDGEPRDSSAAAIAACGMLAMAPYLPEKEAAHYTAEAQRMAKELAKNYAVTDPAVSNGLLLHGVYAKASPYNTVSNSGVDECTTWGDYFYMELLARLSTDWAPFW